MGIQKRYISLTGTEKVPKKYRNVSSTKKVQSGKKYKKSTLEKYKKSIPLKVVIKSILKGHK